MGHGITVTVAVRPVPPPHVGTVLGVGSAHVGSFGSLELTAAAKGELPAALPGDGVAVLNADDPRVAAMPTPARVLTFGLRGDVTWRDVRLDRLSRPSFSLGHAGTWQPVRLRQSGAHQVVNACAAAAAHAGVGAFARAHGVDMVLAVGPKAHPVGGVGVSDIRSALTWLKDHLGPDDAVLVKASRAAELDLIARALVTATSRRL